MNRTTYDHARERNAGQIFTDGKGNRAKYSDRSDGTRQAFGYLIWADGTKGPYAPLPADLRPERYNVTEAIEFAHRIKALGFIVYLAKDSTYGFITDATGSRVVSFSFGGVSSGLSGNYGPPSKESGTGWRISDNPHCLRTAADVRNALNANPPQWCGKGWKRHSTLADHLSQYGKSSGYVRI